MAPRALFFDMDDTLLDTSGVLDVAWEVTCREFAPGLGCEWEPLRAAIRREAMQFWKDESQMTAWRLDLLGARAEVVRLALVAEGMDPSCARSVAERYDHEARSRLKLFDDATATLEELRARGIQLGLLTNGPAELQRWKIARFGLEPYFDTVVIEGAFGAGKPERAVFEHALRCTGAAADEAWHVGDNLYADIGGAKGAGIHAVWIHRDRLELDENPHAIPDRVIGHLHELTSALAE